MLVLSRKKNESIVINDDIVVMVVDIRGDKVRLGIEAPSNVPVHRREVYDAIIRNEQELGGHGEPEEPRRYMPLMYDNLSNLCPNLDNDFYNNKLIPYNF